MKPGLGVGAIVALLAAMIFPLLGGGQIILTRQALLADAEHDARTLSHALAQHASRTIEEVDLALAETLEQVEQDDSPARLVSSLRKRTDVLQQLQDIAILDAQGDCTAQSLPVPPPLSSASRRTFGWHRDHADRGLHVGEMTVDPAAGRPVLTLSRRIDGKDGAFAGVVRAGLNPEYLQSFYNSIDVGQRGSIGLWQDTGASLVRHPALPQQLGGRTVAQSHLAAVFAQGRWGIERGPSPIDGVDRIIVFEHLEHYPLVVTAAISVEDALSGWRHQALLEVLVLALASAGLVSLAFGLQRHQRRAALSELKSRRADAMYRLLADNSSDLIAVKPRDGSHRPYVSPSSAHVVGWNPEEFATLDATAFIHPDDQARVRAEFDSISPEQPRLTSQHRVRHKAGHHIWVEASSQLTASDAGAPVIVVTARDITARRMAEEALKDSETRYRMLAESTSDVITQLGLDFKRRYVSSSCRRMLGYEPEEMLGGQPSAAMHPDDAGAVRAAVDRLVAGAVQGGQITQTYRARHKQGHWVWLEAAINLVCDPRGTPESLICSLRDVTERQLTAQHLEKARAAAEHAARLKSDFVANMSHELRTPLTGILGIHDMLARDPTLGAAQRRYVSIARDAGRSLLAIVNDVLDFSKIEADELTIERLPFDLTALLDTCHHLATEQASGKPLAIGISGERAAWTLLGDAARLRQVLLNLLTNAIKFTDSGTVTIAAGYRRETGRLRIEIADTGIGIAPEKIPLLFRRFSQADTSTTRKYGGTGLGLAISKRLVDLMGGDIGVESVSGRGTTFWIDIPCAEALEEAGRPATPDRPAIVVPCRVLLAEDNIVNQEIISAVLEHRGHVVTTVDNGAAAAAAVIGTSAFDVVLMDVQMPILDGLSATRSIRAAEAKAGQAPIPIIGLTANAMIGDIQRCRDAGMDAHMSKPIEWTQLMSAIHEVTALRPKALAAAAGAEPQADTAAPHRRSARPR